MVYPNHFFFSFIRKQKIARYLLLHLVPRFIEPIAIKQSCRLMSFSSCKACDVLFHLQVTNRILMRKCNCNQENKIRLNEKRPNLEILQSKLLFLRSCMRELHANGPSPNDKNCNTCTFCLQLGKECCWTLRELLLLHAALVLVGRIRRVTSW